MKKLTIIKTKLRLLNIMKEMEKSFIHKDFERCKSCAFQILEEIPDNVNALRALGLCYFMEEDYKNTLKTLNKSIKFSEDKEFEYNYIGWCFCNMDNYKEASETFEKAIEINPLYEPALLGRTQALVLLHIERLEKLKSLEKQLNDNL